MIKFALLCARGHEFQSWFQNSEAFDTQVKSGLVLCPLCQVTEVTKAIMAPAIASRGEAERAKPPARAQSQTKVALLDRHDLKSRAMIDAFRRAFLRRRTMSVRALPRKLARFTVASSPSARSMARQASATHAP